jgi:N-acetylglutamate synthase-like GNAT family acetyltransferase
MEQARRERIGITQNTNFYLARQESDIVGFCGIVFKKDYAVLKNIWVLPEYRRQGIGEAIIAFQIATAKAAGCVFARAFCTPKSIKLFLKQGATITKQYKTSTTVEIRYS